MKKQSTSHRSTNTETSKVMVSIVMPVYNASATVSSTIKSILAQRFVNWELLALDDGSTDNSTEIISSFKDSRIRLILCDHNFIATLNRGFAEAKGKYIARMDADDLMAPERLMIQVAIMDKRKDIDLCSSWMEAFGENMTNRILGKIYGKVNEPILKLFQENILFHPTVMIRNSFWKRHKLQYREYKHAEDYKLWFEMATMGANFYIEAQPLLYYRISKQQITNTHRLEQVKTSQSIRWEILEHLISKSKEKKEIHQLYTLQRNLVEKEFLPVDLVMQQFNYLLEKINH